MNASTPSPGRFTAVELIRDKRDGRHLSDDQIDWMIASYDGGLIADEQIAALLMAIVWRGMDAAEIARWTQACVRSGERLDLSGLSRPTVDKHSTGGVGDKVSLVLVPLVAACGAAVPQLSGRGLGHTGGTLDKLEAIPGFTSALGNEQILDQLEEIGCVICAAGAGLAPADLKLYEGLLTLSWVPEPTIRVRTPPFPYLVRLLRLDDEGERRRARHEGTSPIARAGARAGDRGVRAAESGRRP